jgi:hypothetical protein
MLSTNSGIRCGWTIANYAFKNQAHRSSKHEETKDEEVKDEPTCPRFVAIERRIMTSREEVGGVVVLGE